MEGKGAYNRSSFVQAVGSLPAVALLEHAGRAVALPSPPEPGFIADYGSSEGHNSLVPIAAALGVFRERVGDERAILVFHADVPGNDFTALFETLANVLIAIFATISPYSRRRSDDLTSSRSCPHRA